MVFSAKVLTFTANTSTGDQDLTGTSFTPKAAIVWFTAGNNAVDTFVNGFSFGFGFTDGTNSRCYCNVSEDAVATSDAARIARNDSIIVLLNQTGTLTTEDARASFVQWNADGMRINWSNAPTAAFKLHVLFLGGSDLTNAKVGDITISANGTNVGYTGPGFQPQMLFLVSGHNTAFNTAVGDGSSFVLGVAGCTNSTINFRGGAGFVSEGGGRTAMDTWQLINTGAGITSDMNATTGAIFNTCSIISLDATGFTLTNSSFSVATVKSYLALRGGEYFTTSALEPATTGNTTIEVPTEMTHGAKAVIVFGCDTATGGAIQADNVFSFGAASLDESSVKTQAVTVAADLDAAANAVTTTRYETDSVYLNVTPNATATSSTIDDEATIDSFTNSGFVINWTNIGNARRYFYIVLGNSTTGGTSYDRPISETSITVDQTISRLLAAIRPVNEPSVSNGETLTRLLGALRLISETSITIDQTLTGLRSVPRSISEPAITVDQTLTRLFGATRAITESSITVNQTLTRILGALRSISEPSISSGETLTRILGTLRSINESSISINQTLTRLLGALRSIAETAITTDDSVSGTKQTGGVSITEDAITINDSVTRIQGLIKTITEGTITIDDALVRILGALRTVSEPSISINDSVTRLRETLRTISEDAITIDATLTRIQNITKTITEDTDIDQTLQVLRTSYAIIVEAYVKWYYSLLTFKGGS
jgi:hypothetical protein